LHSFAAKQFERLSHRFPSHAGIFHLLAEVEVVFGFWAIVLWWWSWPWWLAAALPCPALPCVQSKPGNYTEPIFVFQCQIGRKS